MIKRGRKRKNDMYFGPNEEEAVIKFLESTDETERNLIFNEWLREPLNKMIESIIRRYKLYRKGETFDELHSDTLSFLMTKVHKFESGRGKKAYSYFGTITKHYILGLLIKDEKHLKQNSSYEDVSEDLEEREDLTYEIDKDDFMMGDFIKKIIDNIREELDDENLPPKKRLNENEKKVGYALIEILENWETAFESMNGGSKYNKNSVLETMREYTNLSTKDIRLAMKRYKQLYFLLKNNDL
jgi:predicted restriction endonuclease